MVLPCHHWRHVAGYLHGRRAHDRVPPECRRRLRTRVESPSEPIPHPKPRGEWYHVCCESDRCLRKEKEEREREIKRATVRQSWKQSDTLLHSRANNSSITNLVVDLPKQNIDKYLNYTRLRTTHLYSNGPNPARLQLALTSFGLAKWTCTRRKSTIEHYLMLASHCVDRVRLECLLKLVR